MPRLREKPVEKKTEKVKIGKDKKAKNSDGAPLRTGESEFAVTHWDKLVAAFRTDKGVCDALGVADGR